MTNSVNLLRCISFPKRNAWGISCVQNSRIRARLQDKSKIALHFLCWNSKIYKGFLFIFTHANKKVSEIKYPAHMVQHRKNAEHTKYMNWSCQIKYKKFTTQIIDLQSHIIIKIRLTWFFSCISRIDTENSVIVQLKVLNKRFRKAANSSSSSAHTSRNNLFISWTCTMKNMGQSLCA